MSILDSLLILLQPEMAAPNSFVSKTHRIPMMLARLMKKPSVVMMRMGLMERLVMPSNANASIFLSG